LAQLEGQGVVVPSAFTAGAWEHVEDRPTKASFNKFLGEWRQRPAPHFQNRLLSNRTSAIHHPFPTETCQLCSSQVKLK
jgi:hypothetical protein